MRHALALAAACAALASGLPAAAQGADEARNVTDIRCVIVSGAIAQSDDPQTKQIGEASLLYFLGRLEGRGATSNLVARIVDQAGKMSADDMKAQVPTCGAMVTAAGQSLQDLGAALEKQNGASPSPAPK
jgi:hypothetical protein